MIIDENINTDLRKIEDQFKSAISVDCVIFGYDEDYDGLQALTLDCNMPPYEGQFSLVGDLVQPNENLDEAAQRILLERAGFNDVFLEQVKTFGSIDRHPKARVISVAYSALVKLSEFKIASENPHHPSWQPFNHLTEGNMAFDHFEILQASIQYLRKHILTLPVEYMLPNKFTLSQLQSLYEAILNEPLDKRNFRKKILKLDIIKETKEYQKNVAHRPAKLYQLKRNRKKDAKEAIS